MDTQPRYSFIIPVFNEGTVPPLLMRALEDVLHKLNGLAEIIFVDDGGRDATPGTEKLLRSNQAEFH